MKRTVTLVLDDPSGGRLDWLRSNFAPEQLAADLTKQSLPTTLFTGPLEGAPPADVYILLTNNATITARSTVAGYKARLAQTLGTSTVPNDACTLAETHGLLGTIDATGEWFSRHRANATDPPLANFLNVKKALARQLHWPLQELNDTANYSRTRSITMTLPEMIVKYLAVARVDTSL